MKLFFLLLLARAGVTFSQCHAQLEDACRNVTLLITSKGYPCEEHIAITPDGFELSMQRIPFGLSNPIRPGEPPRPAVFLQHGFLDASHTWVINNRFESLGFVLADAGYDVWLGNNRGNIYSNKNTHLSNDTDAFWAFSWDEFAQFDVLTQVDEVLRVNGRSNVTYIGHSQGTTQMFAALASSWATKIRARVNLFVALAPVALLSHQKSYFFYVASRIPKLALHLALGEKAFPNAAIDRFLQTKMPLICHAIGPQFCRSLLFVIGGCNGPSDCDLPDFNATRAQVYTSHIGGSSVRDLIHFNQLASTSGMHKYDFGHKGNLLHYGQPTAPSYDLRKLRSAGVPVAFFSGGNDSFADPTDVANVKAQIGSALVFEQEIPAFMHLDFVWGIHAVELMYQPNLLPLLQKYNA